MSGKRNPECVGWGGIGCWGGAWEGQEFCHGQGADGEDEVVMSYNK